MYLRQMILFWYRLCSSHTSSLFGWIKLFCKIKCDVSVSAGVKIRFLQKHLYTYTHIYIYCLKCDGKLEWVGRWVVKRLIQSKG